MAFGHTLAIDVLGAVTGKEIDRMNFKVPTLRNVELTYPYFHDGAANTLPEAVDVMGGCSWARRPRAKRTPTSSRSCRR
jgi:cytochrome c peroxidase